MEQRKYDSTVARVAGNIASGLVHEDDIDWHGQLESIANTSVKLARLIVAEVQRAELREKQYE